MTNNKSMDEPIAVPKWDEALEALVRDEYQNKGEPLTVADLRRHAMEKANPNEQNEQPNNELTNPRHTPNPTRHTKHNHQTHHPTPHNPTHTKNMRVA